jgi:TatA/E family protein of Tat protein translocase
MNILGMGPLELLLIVVIALIVFGPAKLPEIMGQVGKAINDFRRATSELSDEFNRTIQAELQEGRTVLDETKSAVTEVHSAVADAHSSVTSAVTGLPAPTRVAGPGETLPAANGTSSEPHFETTTNGALPAQVQPPLAETTPWSWETSPASPPQAAATAPTEPSAGVASEPSAPAPSTVESTQPQVPAPVEPVHPAQPEASRTVKELAPARDDILPPY